ncbi:hypothetical protein AVEN_56737-1 [Araneus ventricosus]|uniref:Uncharacterized protein n=1 Tax=Araneus ventricosus TaxID=182803 RepID=A0A4Y2Q9W1_ARAVE|nr:hypothetical protein AVEN_56737-1 [Araneus ventricosus]
MSAGWLPYNGSSAAAEPDDAAIAGARRKEAGRPGLLNRRPFVFEPVISTYSCQTLIETWQAKDCLQRSLDGSKSGSSCRLRVRWHHTHNSTAYLLK